MIELPEISVSAGSPPSDMRYTYGYVERYGKECAAAVLAQCAATSELGNALAEIELLRSTLESRDRNIEALVEENQRLFASLPRGLEDAYQWSGEDL